MTSRRNTSILETLRRAVAVFSRRCAPIACVLGWLAIVFATPGCQLFHRIPETIGQDTSSLDAVLCDINSAIGEAEPVVEPTTAPVTLRSAEEIEGLPSRDLSLAEALAMALHNQQILRDLGAGVLRAPDQAIASDARSIFRTDPQQSIEAALSAFDAELYALGKFQNNDRRFNNRFFGGGANSFKQDTHDYVFQLSKRTATGAQFSLRSVTDYDANNATGNQFNSAWQTQFHAEARQPLLQGGGLLFNRIAGPASQIGVYNGVLIAQVNSEITNAEFEQGLRDYVSNVINAYWDLYFAYRDADAKREAMERSGTTWKSYEAQVSSNRQSGAAEALAREQYFRFRSEFQDAVAGKPSMRTQNNNSATGGAFAGVGGIQAAERRLRLILGMPITDGTLLRPSEDPPTVRIDFEWESIASQAIRSRIELKQQRLKVGKREMQLQAARNYLMPTLDLVTIYRLRGLDKRLAGDQSAFSDLAGFDLQEYEASLEMRLPVGFRQAHLGVRHAKLQVARERALLEEQERQIIHDLTAMVAEADRAFAQMDTNMNRYLAASDALAALNASREAGLPINFDQLLDAQRRVSESQTRYYASVVEYTLAVKNVHLEKGTLLQANDVLLVVNETEATAF